MRWNIFCRVYMVTLFYAQNNTHCDYARILNANLLPQMVLITSEAWTCHL